MSQNVISGSPYQHKLRACGDPTLLSPFWKSLRVENKTDRGSHVAISSKRLKGQKQKKSWKEKAERNSWKGRIWNLSENKVNGQKKDVWLLAAGVVKIPNKTWLSPPLPQKWEINARNYLTISGWNRKGSHRGGDGSYPTTVLEVHLQHEHGKKKNPCDVSWEASIKKTPRSVKERGNMSFLKKIKAKSSEPSVLIFTEYKTTVQHLFPCGRGARDTIISCTGLVFCLGRNVAVIALDYIVSACFAWMGKEVSPENSRTEEKLCIN